MTKEWIHMEKQKQSKTDEYNYAPVSRERAQGELVHDEDEDEDDENT